MEIKLDLHVHSERSLDGCMHLDDIVSQARTCGLQGIAVCDHDLTLEHVPQYDDFVVIPGIEVSTERGHLLGLFVSQPIQAKQFDKAVDAIHACGGLAVMAHPFERSRDAGRLDDVMYLMDGIEVWNGRADRKNKQANAMALALAKQWNKPVTAGSDAHVLEEIGNGAVVLTVDALTETAIKHALLCNALRVEGRRGRSVCVAKSQLTKRKKTHASAPAYMKWALFAAKCWIEDRITGEIEEYVIDCKGW